MQSFGDVLQHLAASVVDLRQNQQRAVRIGAHECAAMSQANIAALSARAFEPGMPAET